MIPPLIWTGADINKLFYISAIECEALPVHNVNKKRKVNVKKKLNKQEDCTTCDGQGYWFYTTEEIDEWCRQGGDYWNITNKCPDCDNNSYDCGGVFPRIANKIPNK